MRIQFDPDEILVCDGAMGTMLQEAGLPSGGCPELWNLEEPEAILGIHRAYVEAGARIIESNTFGATPLKLADYGLEDQSFELARAGAALARKAAGDRALVAGSVGPTGGLVEPMGPLSYDDLEEAFMIQIRGLAEGGADLILIETMMELSECRAAVTAARRVAPELPVIAQMTFGEDGNTVMGTSPETAALVLEALGADFAGVNCSTGPEGLLDVVRRMGQVTRLPLSVQPNAGMPVMENGRTVYRATPEHMARYASDFVQAGAAVLGGCCGTRPEHIRAIARAAADIRYQRRNPDVPVSFSSRRGTVFLQGAVECAMIAGSAREPRGLQKEARAAAKKGARILGFSGQDFSPREAADLLLLMKGPLDIPLVFDAQDPRVVELLLRRQTGQGTLRGIHGKTSPGIVALAVRYGANLILSVEDPASISQWEALLDPFLKMGIPFREMLATTVVWQEGVTLEDPAVPLPEGMGICWDLTAAPADVVEQAMRIPGDRLILSGGAKNE